MDVGAITVFLHTFTEREKIYNLCESLTGARFTTNYTRIGGLARALPPGWVEQCRQFLREVVVNIGETETLLSRNRIFVDRTQGVGVISNLEPRAVEAWLESEEIHRSQTAGGASLICLNSLLKRVQKAKTA